MTSIVLYNRLERKAAFRRRWLTAGDASDYICRASDAIKPGDKVVLCCRVSGYAQNCNGNLADQETNLKRKMDQLGANIVDSVSHTGSGFDPAWLERAATLAEKHGAALVAETSDRFIRHPLYHSNDHPKLQARNTDLEDLRSCTYGIPLVTDLPPDASPSDVRGYQRRRGQRMKGRPGGRPRNATHAQWKMRRLARIDLALRLRDKGESYEQIAPGVERAQRWLPPCD